MTYEVSIGEKIYRVELSRSGCAWQCNLDGRAFSLDVVPTQRGVLSFLIGGKSYEVRLETGPEGVLTGVSVGASRFMAVVRDPRSLRTRRSHDLGQGIKKITAPMPGKVVRILTPAGAEVDAGQGVLAIEAMKMQNELKSPKKGRVTKITVNPGDAVEAGQVLAEVE